MALKKTHLRVILSAMAALLAITAWVTLTQPAFLAVAGTARELPIYCVQSDYSTASLSFDAAWGNEDTQELIDILQRYNVKATFFVVGDWVRKYPESVKALHDAGHEVMSHSNKHDHMTKLTAEQIKEDIKICNEEIAKVTGVTPTLFRPPYGEYDNKVVTTLRSINMEVIQWDVDSLDWKDLTAPQIQKRVLERVKPGSIILFHNAAKHTPSALPGIIEALLTDGYQLIPISQHIHKGEFTIDHTGRQIPKKPPAAGPSA